MNKNGMFSNNENIDYSISTKKRMASEKILLLICAGIAAFCDFMLLIVSAVVGYNVSITIFPVFMLLADALFIVAIVFSNFRFKYSLWVWISYVAFSLFMTILLFVLNGGFYGYEIMTTTACALYILSHTILWIVIGLCALFSNLKKDIKHKIILCLVVGLGVIFVFSYSVFVASNGYLGQGESNTLRAVVYEYDKNTDTYTAKDIAQGRGEKVIIPDTFNGKKVNAVDVKIFGHNDISNIVLESKDELSFVNLSSSSQINENISIGIDRELIDTYRNKFFNQNNLANITLANCMYPTDLNSDEVYISFYYDFYESSEVRNNILPTYIGKKNQAFDLSYLTENISYIDNSDQTDNEDLHWSFVNNEGYIFSDIVSQEKSIIGQTLQDNVMRAEVQFERVYRVKFLDDNDTKYEADDTFKHTFLSDNEYYYRYTTINQADNLLSELSREGFELDWINNKGVNIGRLSSYLEANIFEKDDLVEIKPRWTLNAPVISKIFSQNDIANIFYGDNVVLDAEVAPPVEGYNLNFKWTNPSSKNLGSDKILSLAKVLPDMSGTYTLQIEAWSDETSLTSQSSQTITLNIMKKPVVIVWTFPENCVYDGQAKTAVYDYDKEVLIDKDMLAFEDDITSVKDAGNYKNTVVLTDEWAKLYELKNNIFEYSVAKRPVSVTWDDLSYVYNGELQHPLAESIENVLSGEENIVRENIKYHVADGINAGQHTVSLSLNAKNYTFDKTQAKQYTIEKREIQLIFGGKSEVVYNGYTQYPLISDIDNIIEKDKEAVLKDIVYENMGRNVGKYNIEAKLGDNSSNYVLSSPASKEFKITPKDIVIKAVAPDKTYDGQMGGNFSVEIQGLAYGDSYEDFGVPVFGGDAIAAIDVGTYTLEVSYPPNDTTNNYNITRQSTTFTITKRVCSLVWTENVFDMDGIAHAPEVETYKQPYEGQISVSYKYYDNSGKLLDEKPVKAGSYSVEAIITSQNFQLTNTKISFTIREVR